MKIDLTKNFSKFARVGRSISRVIQTNLPEGYDNHLPHYPGMHTVKFDSTYEMDINPNKQITSYFTEENIFKGFLESKDARVIHFIDNKPKAIKTISESFYHAIADDLAEIVSTILLYPDIELILDVSDIAKGIDHPTNDFFRFFLDCLEKEKIKYTLVDFSKFDIVYINDFRLISFPFHSGARLDLLYEFLKKHLKFPTSEPTKKIFISRGITMPKEASIHTKNFTYPNDNRIDSHGNLEKIFEDLGFEIVHAEHIMNFQSQLDLFMNAKTIAGLTGSGLTNAIFMKPGGTVIEIATPLITQSPLIHAEYLQSNKIDPKEFEVDVNMVQEIHTFYQNMAFFKNHTYLSIPNFNRKSEDVKAFIEASPKLKAFLKDD